MNKNIVMSVAVLASLPALAFLQNVTPESQGIPSSAIEDFVDACERELDGVHSFVLVRHGEIVAEGYWSPFSADRTHLLFSHSKSFTSTAAGFLVDDGKLDLDERVVDIFPEHVTEKTSENMRQIEIGREKISFEDILSIESDQGIFAPARGSGFPVHHTDTAAVLSSSLFQTCQTNP